MVFAHLIENVRFIAGGPFVKRGLISLGLFYGVQRFFKEVEDKLAAGTKEKITAWLLNVKISEAFRSWKDTFPEIFDRVFGANHVSWKCFARSSFMSVLIALAVSILTLRLQAVRFTGFFFVTIVMLCSNLLPDYASLLKSRYLIKLSRNWSTGASLLLFFIDLCGSYLCAVAAYYLGFEILINAAKLCAFFGKYTHSIPVLFGVLGLALKMVMVYGFVSPRYLWLYPAFWVPLWLLLYVCSGFLLKGSITFELGMRWINRTLDIKMKPLQSIGLVSGFIIAIFYLMFPIVTSLIS
ncbi:MAG TPA: hypothetical protein VGY31_07630 [Terriglobia bacterium]|nr:hypothetical protein [Terriglobia bacterium]